jgi:hypothetical protein
MTRVRARRFIWSSRDNHLERLVVILYHTIYLTNMFQQKQDERHSPTGQPVPAEWCQFNCSVCPMSRISWLIDVLVRVKREGRCQQEIGKKRKSKRKRSSVWWSFVERGSDYLATSFRAQFKPSPPRANSTHYHPNSITTQISM